VAPPGTTPAGAPDETGRRVAHLPAAVVGNGSLLATVSARGEIERLWWPNLDANQHLDELRLGLHDGEAVRWLDEEPFAWEQRYLDDTTVLVSEARGHGLAAETTDFVLADASVLVRRVRATGSAQRLVAYLRPQLDEALHGQGCYVDLERGALVFHRRDTVLAIGIDVPHEVTCGRSVRGETYSVFADVQDGRLDGYTVAHRGIEGALACDLRDGAEALLVLSLGRTPDVALASLDAALATGVEQLLADRRRHDRDRVGTALAAIADELEPLYRRSLLVFDLVSDVQNGGVIAGPEMDPKYENSGGYGFVWARDLAFTILAFLACGREDLARRGLGWLVRTQEPEGLWLQRHWTDGRLARALVGPASDRRDRCRRLCVRGGVGRAARRGARP
jgi:GH15 family glucan-1,4-alpha-glucosidase